MSNTILYRMSSGIPGAVSREEQKTIEATPYGASAFPGYGLPCKWSAGTVVPIGAADTAALVIGLLVRPYPISDASATPALGTAVPPTTGIANVLRRGYMTVVCNAGTPALGSTVYVRTAVPAGAKVIGGIEAVADGVNNFALTNAVFNGVADANGNVEVAFNI